MDNRRTRAFANAARQKRYRERKRGRIPTNEQFAYDLCRVVFDNVDNDGLKPAEAISQARSRLLDRFAIAGINSTILRVGARR